MSNLYNLNSQDESPLGRTEWRKKMREVGEDEGFFEDLGDQHTALFIRRSNTLVVTFENLDHVYERSETKLPWAFDFIAARNWSILGLMAHDWTWYRDENVYDFFDRLRDEGFFEGFDKVVFYGASMGAYAATVFSSASPGATVIAISPQATLDRDLAIWETRYLKAWRKDFTNRYGYGPDLVRTAEIVHLFYDPSSALDSMHACLFQSDNVLKYRCRFMGHRIASLWQGMGILKPVVEKAVDGTLERGQFFRWMRKRKEAPRYQKELLQQLKKAGNLKRLIWYCELVLASRGAPMFRAEMRAARQQLSKSRK